MGNTAKAVKLAPASRRKARNRLLARRVIVGDCWEWEGASGRRIPPGCGETYAFLLAHDGMPYFLTLLRPTGRRILASAPDAPSPEEPDV